MKRLQRITAVVLSLVLLLALCACGEQDDTVTLRVSLPEEVTTLDPAMVTSDTEKIVVSHLYENLMKLTSDREGGTKIANGLAKSYQCENNLDGTQTYTFTLRDSITWSDGQAVTAADFVYAWQRLVDPATASPNADVLEMVAGYDAVRSSGDVTKLQVSAPDERTLVVVLSHSCLYFAEVVGTHAATMPVRADVAEQENWSMSAATLVTNGAYRQIDQWADGALTVSVGEGYYDARRLGPDALRFTFGGQGAEEADFVLRLDGVDEESDAWNIGTYPQVGMLVMNQMGTLSQELRQAMSLTIDRNHLSELLGSVYVPAEGLIPAGIRTTQGTDFRTAAGALIDNDPERYEARCQEAQALLQGQTLPESGNVTVVYVSDPATDQVAQTLQDTWREQLGLTVTLQAMDQEELVTALRKGDFTMALVMMESERNDAGVLLQSWTSAAEENYAHINNSAYDLLMRISDTCTSAEARDAYLSDAERMLLESGYVVPICFVTNSWQLNENLTGVLTDGVGGYFFSYVVEKAK